MDSECWKQIDSLLQAALPRPPAERAEFLRQACAGDEAAAARAIALAPAGSLIGQAEDDRLQQEAD
jgi:hypothetical protein